MVKNGVLDDVDVVLGLHVNNGLDSGTIGFHSGTFMASCRNFTIEMFGKAAHATRPESGHDALAAAVEVYNGIQTVTTRQITP